MPKWQQKNKMSDISDNHLRLKPHEIWPYRLIVLHTEIYFTIWKKWPSKYQNGHLKE